MARVHGQKPQYGICDVFHFADSSIGRARENSIQPGWIDLRRFLHHVRVVDASPYAENTDALGSLFLRQALGEAIDRRLAGCIVHKGPDACVLAAAEERLMIVPPWPPRRLAIRRTAQWQQMNSPNTLISSMRRVCSMSRSSIGPIPVANAALFTKSVIGPSSSSVWLSKALTSSGLDTSALTTQAFTLCARTDAATSWALSSFEV